MYDPDLARWTTPDPLAEKYPGISPYVYCNDNPVNYVDPDAIRGREQQPIELNGGAKSQGGASGNAINGISPTNPKRQRYEDARRKEFGQ